MFLQSIKEMGVGSFTPLNDKSELVYSVNSPSNLSIRFYPTYITFSYKDSNSLKLDYDELVAATTEKSGTKIIISLSGQKITYDTADAEKADKENIFLKSVQKAFREGSESSPYENIRILCEENGIYFDGTYNKYLYYLLLKNSDFYDLINHNTGFPENCSIEYILEEHTASLFDDAAGTVSNLASSFLSGNLVGTLVNTGKRFAKSVGNELIGNSGILIVTNINVIYVKSNNVEVIGETLEEAWESLEAMRDTTVQGAIDIFFNGAKILDNVSGKLWSEYKNTLRKLKNKPKINYIEDNSVYDSNIPDSSSEYQSSDDELNTIESKLTQLKRMLDSNIISQDDYETKKNDILGLSPVNTFQSTQVPATTVQNVQDKLTTETKTQISKAPPLKKKIVENTDNKKTKNHVVALLLCFFLGFLGIHRFYYGKIKTGLLMAILTILGFYFSETDFILLLTVSYLWAVVDFILLVLKRFPSQNKVQDD